MPTRTAARLALPLALFALLAALFGPPAASATPPRAPRPGTVRVVSPAYRALVTGPELTLKLAVGAGVSHLSVKVAGRPAHLGHGGSGDSPLATISTKALPAGPVRVTVTGRHRGHAISSAGQVVIGHHDAKLLGAVRLARHAVGEAHLHVRLGGEVTDFGVTVNGRRAHLLETPAQPVPSRRSVVIRRRARHGHPAGRIARAKRGPVPSSTIRLSADDGLRPGRNTVVVLAYRESDGSWARAVRHVWVSPQAPLVAAGQDRRVAAGSTTRLDGSNSRPAPGTSGLAYDWQIVDQPDGSDQGPRSSAPARLLGRHSVRPHLVTHRPGTYKVALHVGPRGAGDDVVTLQAGAPFGPYGVRIATNQAGASESACREEDENCWVNRNKTTIEGVALGSEGADSVEATSEGVLLVVLNRTTLAKISTQAFQPNEVPAALAAAEAVKSSELAIVSANPRSPESEAGGGKGGGGEGGGGEGEGEHEETQKEEEEHSHHGGQTPKEHEEEQEAFERAEREAREEEENDGASLVAAAAKKKVEVPAGAAFTIVLSGGEVLASNIGHSIGGPPGALEGVLRKQNGPDDYYTYDSPETVEFDTYVKHGGEVEMEVGGKAYPMATSTETGIAIEALNGALGPNSSLSHFYALAGTSADESTLEAVAARLKQIAEAEPGTVLMLQTIGDPKAERPAWGAVGAALESFGGTPTVWDELDGTGNYALVGTAYPGHETAATRSAATVEASGPMEGGEASEALKPWVGTTRGVLGRGPNSFPIVRASTSLPRGVIKLTKQEEREREEEEKTGEVNKEEIKAGEGTEEVEVAYSPFELMTLAEAPPKAWPLSDERHEAALEYISKELDLGNPREAENGNAAGWCFEPKKWDARAEYCDTNIVSEWGTKQEHLGKLAYQANEHFGAQEFTEVVKQLKLEFADIPDVIKLFETLREPFHGTSGGLAAAFKRGADKVNSDVLKPEEQELAEKEMVEIFDAMLTPAQDAAGGGLSVFFGAVESGLNLGLDYAESKDGMPAAGPLGAETGEGVTAEAEARIKDAVAAISTLEEIVLTDWGKLSATHARASRAAWSTKPRAVEGIEADLETGAQAWFYETLMSASYGQIQVAPETPDFEGVKWMECGWYIGRGITSHPFEEAAESDVFHPLVGVSATGEPVPAPYLWLIADTPSNSKDAEMPSGSLTESLFKPVGNGGIGLYQAPFFTWSFIGSRHALPEYVSGKVDGLGHPDFCKYNPDE
jgi:hypothetical protein